MILKEKCYADLTDCTNGGDSTRGECIEKLKVCLQDCKKVCPALHNEISSVHKVFSISLIDCEIRVTYLYYIKYSFCDVSLLITKVSGLNYMNIDKDDQYLPRIHSSDLFH